MTNLEIPTYDDIVSAQRRLDGHARWTPLLISKRLNEISGFNLYLKNETAQKTGTFKYRGARARMSLLSKDALKRGVVAFSSGNHAQGVALNARELGTFAVIVMPKSAPQTKKDGTSALGAEIVEYDIATQDREKIAREIANETGRIIVPAFDDKYVIAGQGTIGLEVLQQCQEQNVKLDGFFVPMGGGGLCAGTSLALKTSHPAIKIYGVEPERFDDQRRSLLTGERQSIPKGGSTLCDALMSPMPGRITFAINKTTVEDIYTVSDLDVLLTIALVYETLGIKLEPGGAAALSAVLRGGVPFSPGANIGVVLSGGNIDSNIFELAISTARNIMHQA